MTDQDQFLDVIDRDEAQRRFRTALLPKPLGEEIVLLPDALGRVTAVDIVARVDVPSFDRSNFDGYAVRSFDTLGATELAPRMLELLDEWLDAGTAPTSSVGCSQAIAISTGGMIPRGADAILMVEHAELLEELKADDGTAVGRRVLVRRAVTPGQGVAFAGTDVSTGETVIRGGTILTSRETGVLAALGETHVRVWRRPRVAIISTGNEIIAPGEPMRPAAVYDSNSRVIADAVRELGGEPQFLGIVRDDLDALRTMMQKGLADSDIVLLSGGTSKGKGDLCYRVVAELTDPGIVAHGVALKPGKPLCLAVSQGKPVVVLPGFPTSAIFTFHEFVAPVIRLLGGRRSDSHETVDARLALKVNSEIGRTEFLLVGLVKTPEGLAAFPMGKGSGSVTTFSRADGFVTIPRHTEIVNAGEPVQVRLIDRQLEVADLIVIGSHCVGLDWLLSELQRRGFSSKLLNVGSTAGLQAAKRGECDVAGIHLLDPVSGEYNRPFLSDEVTLIRGYGRSQGILFRKDDARFAERTMDEITSLIRASGSTELTSNQFGQSRRESSDQNCVMVNRNQGSGTRILIDRLLAGAKPPGYAVQPTNHNAVAAAIVQHRADWGMAIASVADSNILGFVPYQQEHYDFVVPTSRLNNKSVRAFIQLLSEQATQTLLESFGFQLDR